MNQQRCGKLHFTFYTFAIPHKQHTHTQKTNFDRALSKATGKNRSRNITFLRDTHTKQCISSECGVCWRFEIETRDVLHTNIRESWMSGCLLYYLYGPYVVIFYVFNSFTMKSNRMRIAQTGILCWQIGVCVRVCV